MVDSKLSNEMTHISPTNGASAAVSRMADALDRVGTVPKDVRFSNPLSLFSYLPGSGRPGSMLPGAAYGIPAAVVNTSKTTVEMVKRAIKENELRLTGRIPPGTPLSDDMLGVLLLMSGGGMSVAPKNAVGMSGGRLASAVERLPMDEASRMARAAEGGFNYPGYHLTKSDFNEFKLNSDPTSHTGGGAIWLRDNPQSNVAAHQVSSPREIYVEGARDIPVYARTVNQPPPSVISDLQQQKKLSWDFPRRISMEENRLLRSMGYDSVEQRGELAVLDPKNIRSRFAAFDPTKRDSADILSSRGVGPMSLPFLPKSEPLAQDDSTFVSPTKISLLAK